MWVVVLCNFSPSFFLRFHISFQSYFLRPVALSFILENSLFRVGMSIRIFNVSFFIMIVYALATEMLDMLPLHNKAITFVKTDSLLLEF